MTRKTTTRSTSDPPRARKSRRKGWPQGRPLYQSPLPPDVPGAWFDQEAVDRVLRAMRALKHTKGEWAGLPLAPDDWQLQHIIAPVFGWKHPDGSRIIRTAWVEIPRKNGKSTLASAFAIVLLCADGEPGAEVYSAAASRDQARIIFAAAKDMARGNRTLASKLDVQKDVIFAPRTLSAFRSLSRVAEVAHGLNVHAALIDEVHVHRQRGLVDALETGTGARRQPLVMFITTADEGEQTSIYAEKHEYAIATAQGIIHDPTFYGVIWAAEEQDDPFAESTWRKANPGLGVSVKLDYLRKEAQRAKDSPSYLPVFLRLSLNRRVRSEARYIRLVDWDRSAGIVKLEELRGRECYGGLDLSSTTDVSAFVLVFPRNDLEPDPERMPFDVLAHFWIPGENILEKERQDKAQYRLWARNGLMTATPGNVIDYASIQAHIVAQSELYDLRDIGFDRWGATQMAQNLEAAGLTVVPIGQGFASLSSPSKELLKLALQRRIRHGGHQVLRWMMDNAVVKTDPAENIKPDKDHSTGRIDGVVALIMALDRAIRNGSRSVYDGRGLEVI